MAAKLRKMDFEALIAKGENPKGFTAQTAAGTAHTFGTGWNFRPTGEPMPQAPVGGAWQGGRSNRTGE